MIVTPETCRAIVRLNKPCDLCILLELYTRSFIKSCQNDDISSHSHTKDKCIIFVCNVVRWPEQMPKLAVIVHY